MDVFDLHLDLQGKTIPRFIAVEGPIGVGKTTLACNLAKTFNCGTLLEQPGDNPFLERFYQDREASALANQLFFLLQRARQMQELPRDDLFAPGRVADFLIAKDPLFAQVTLDDDELAIYQQVYAQLTLDIPKPDLVIYLQAPVDILHTRIRQRGIKSEQAISADYLTAINDAYMRFFHYYDESPLLIVNATELDLAGNPDHYQQLVENLLKIGSGRHYYNPAPLL